jgi:uncharacterized protein (DUF885 family)
MGMILMMVAMAGGGCGGGEQSSFQPLADLAEEYWQAHLKASPVSATSLGDRRYDNLLTDITPEGRAKRRAELEGFLARAEALLPEDLNSADRLTRSALITEIRESLSRFDCGLQDWVVDPLGGPQVSFFSIPSYQPIRTPDEGRAMVERWRAIGPYMDAHVANLEAGLAEDKVAIRMAVEKVIEELNDLLKKPDDEWALLRPLETGHPEWSEADREEFEEELRASVAEVVRPAMAGYKGFLETSVLPRARANDEPGLYHVPGGGDCYQQLIRVYTSLDLPAEEIHELGLKEVAKINRETEELGEIVFGIGDRMAILEKLRTDSGLYFETRDQVQAKADSALSRAKTAMVDWFGILPQADCNVVRMEPFEEKHSTIAYYRQPAVDGSRPGSYYINTYAPETRPRYEAEALAYHEAIPGHHLQIAISQELTDIPEFRKHQGVTAFVEGWALYTERLSNEMGLYSSDLDRMGMLSYDSWRACRLVVDTGMHAKGWTRDQAIQFMIENSALAKNNITNEVDRYITWPGQALAYKIGQLEIFRLREKAKTELGEDFDIKEFHDTVLRNGAVALEPLREAVDEYIRSAKAAAQAG